MSSSVSSEHIHHQPNASSSSDASVSVTPQEPHRGSIPTTRSRIPPLPSMLRGKAFEVRQFNRDDEPVAHRQPLLTPRDTTLSPLPDLFARIDANDRDFVQQLPALVRQPAALDRLLKRRDPETGRTPLAAALTEGHLDLAVDFMMLGARPSANALYGSASVDILHDDGIASMLIDFMLWHDIHQPSPGQPVDKRWQKALNKIDRPTGHTLLTWAISQRHDKLVELLIDSGADARAANQARKTALQEACSTGSISVVSRLLQHWSESGEALREQEVIAAIGCAVKADRPMVIAQLLSFFRDEYRFRQGGLPEAEDDHPLHPVTSNPLTQRDAYSFFLGSQRASSATLDVMFDRTGDNFLLTERESLLLNLDKIVVWAANANQTKIVDIIRAHAKLPQGS